MDKKSKVLLWIMAILILASVGVTYWRIMIKKDYVISAQADCDPTSEKCFVSHCDPSTDTTCTGDEEKDTTYFKKVQRVAANIPLCDPAEESCKPWDCNENEKDCTATFCDDSTMGKDEECSNPETYNAAHPATDDSGDGSACDPSDDSCKTDTAVDASSDSSGDSGDAGADAAQN